MQLSWKVFLAPIFGAFFGWLASKGLNLTADQQNAAIGLSASIVTALGHWWHEKTQATTAAPSTNKQSGRSRLETLLLLLLSAIWVWGCTSLGLLPPQTTQQQIAYGYSGVTAALNTLASATTAGLLSSSEATQANTAILAAKTTLDQANTATSSNASNAVTLLTSATAALATVSAYLTCKQQRGTASCQL